MRQKSSSIHGDYGDFRGVLLIKNRQIRQNYLALACIEDKLKE
jgi:hypothetical protein